MAPALPDAPAVLAAYRLPEVYDYISPGGVAEIRQMHRIPDGEITHVRVPADKTSTAAWLEDITEMWFVLAGTGLLWIDDGQRAEEVRLLPGRAVRIPAFAVFQYRSDPGENLIFLLAAVPQWQPNLAHRADRQHWSPSAPGAEEDRFAPAHLPGEPMVVRDLRVMADHAAPDGSQIRLLVSTAAGGMAYCLLPQGQRTRPVRHKTVSEIWYVLDGHGELARWDTDTVPTVLALSAGTSISIPPRTPFQFRTTGLDPLRLMLLTMPAWPGAAEAEAAPRRLDAWSHLP